MMQFGTGIKMLLLTVYAWEFNNNALWDAHLHALFYSTIIDVV